MYVVYSYLARLKDCKEKVKRLFRKADLSSLNPCTKGNMVDDIEVHGCSVGDAKVPPLTKL